MAAESWTWQACRQRVECDEFGKLGSRGSTESFFGRGPAYAIRGSAVRILGGFIVLA
jgi:hypothetical protein